LQGRTVFARKRKNYIETAELRQNKKDCRA